MEKYKLEIRFSSSLTPNNSVDKSWGGEIEVNSLKEAVDVATAKLKNRLLYRDTKRCSIELTLKDD